MTGFSSEWLALREPLDRRARNADVLDVVAATFADRPGLSVVDLGSGTGSTFRALHGRLPRPQHWRLVDDDPILLAEAAATARPAAVTLDAQQFDLRGDIASLFDESTGLVTASALLDLVSEPWLANLAAAVAARALPIYVALTYDGRTSFSTFDPIDTLIVTSVNAHQRKNKGFGPALGPYAMPSVMRIFQSLGYTVTQGKSDWEAGPDDAKFQTELLAGWLHAAGDMGDLSMDTLEGWFTRRCRAVEAGALTIGVGHVDFFAQPKKR